MKNQGLNNFDIVYYINLEHRKDRYTHINNELKKTNIEPSKINRINGVYMKNFGCLGCSKSHILALEAFLETPDDIQNCIILEDDFVFTQNQDVCNDLINKFYNYCQDYDVLLLSGNILKYYTTNIPFIINILDSQTTSGYCVSKKFAQTLLKNYKEGAYMLEKTGYKTHDYCIDIYMKKLQPVSRWFCLEPKIGKQIDSYSDIESCKVSYSC